MVAVGKAVTVTVVEPDFFVSCVDVAVSVAMPVAAGVKMPELPTVPALDGDTDHETPLLKLPVPVTEAVQVDVWFEKIEAGTQLADTDVTEVGAVTTTLAAPDMLG